MAKIHWKSGAIGIWADSANWAGSVVPDLHDDARIASGDVEIASDVAVHSLQVINSSTDVSVDAATALTVVKDFSNAGDLNINAQEGGSRLSVGGTFTNSGVLTIGGFNLGAATTVTAAALTNTGFISLTGNGADGTIAQATLDVKSAAPTTYEGACDLFGDALLKFAGGSIRTIGSGAELLLGSALSRVADAGAAHTNSALSALIANQGTFGLGAGVSVVDTAASFHNQGEMTLEGARFSLAGSYANMDRLFVDKEEGDGGSHLEIEKTLFISGDFVGSFVLGNDQLSASDSITVNKLICASGSTVDIIGNTHSDTHDQATLNILSAAPAALTGIYELEGDAVLAFASGGITNITVGSLLEIDGLRARVAIAGALTTNSALQNLADNKGDFGVSDEASLYLKAAAFTNDQNAGLSAFGGAALSFAGDLSNAGNIGINAGSGGSTVTTQISIAGALTNTGSIYVGTAEYPSAPSIFTTHTFNNGGTLILDGDIRSNGQQATFIVTGGDAPAVFDATFQLSGDALLQFAGGKIGMIASDGVMSISGDQARIAEAGDTAHNSAFDLSENDGTLNLIGGASLASDEKQFLNTGSMAIRFGSGFSLSGGVFSQESGTTVLQDGNLSASKIVIHGGLLEGDGQVTGAVINAGSIFASIPQTTEKLAIQGSYSQSIGGTLETSILAATDQTNLVAVSGNVSLAGTLEVDILDPDALQLKERFTILEFAPGHLSGTFGAIVDGDFTGDGSHVDIGNGLSLIATYAKARGEVFLTVVKTASQSHLSDIADGHADLFGTAVHHGDFFL